MAAALQSPPGRSRPVLRGAVVAFAMVLVLASACGGESIPRAEDQPVTQDTGFGYGGFDEIPLYGRSEALGDRVEKAGAVSQSFKARGATPTQILGFYARRLKEKGWNVIEPVHELGPGTVRGRWAEPKWMLTVSASAAPAITAPAGVIEEFSQYSFSLRPAVVPSAEGPPERSATPLVEDSAGFVDHNYQVTPVRDYDPIPDETNFSWQISGDAPADHVIVQACRDVPLIFALGPDGPPAEPEPVTDPATPGDTPGPPGTGLSGVKWKSGTLGNYTVGYKGPVSVANLFIKSGAGTRRIQAGRFPCADAPSVDSVRGS